MRNFIEQLKVYLKILSLNRRSTLLAFIGLGCSLALVSEGLIFTYSFQYGAFTDFTRTSTTKQLTLNLINFELPDDPRTVYDGFHNITDKVSKNLGIDDKIRRIDWYFEKNYLLEVELESTGDMIVIPEDIHLYGISFDYFSILQTLLFNGTLPEESNNPTVQGDALVVAKNSTFQKTNLNELGRFSLYERVFGGYSYAGKINLTGCIAREDFASYDGPNAFDLQAMLDYFTEEFMLICVDNFPDVRLKALCRYSFYLEDFNSLAINQEIQTINALIQEVQRELETAGYPLHIYDDLTPLLQEFRSEFFLFQLYGLLFLTPLIVVAIYLSNYSANLLKKRQRQHIASLFQRGAAQSSIWFMLGFQIVEVAFSSLIVGLVIGYPFTWLMLKSSGFLQFSSFGVYPAVNNIIFYTIAGLAFLLSFLINSKDIWVYRNLTVIEAQHEVQSEKSFWKKFYLDLLLLGIGIALWLLVRFELGTIAANSFAYGFGTLAPICVILGGILVSARLFNFLNKIFAKRLMQRKSSILGFSMLRNSRRQKNATRGLILLSLTFTLIIANIISIESYKLYETESAYYSLGADIYVGNTNVYDENTLAALEAIDGVNNATYIFTTRQILTYGSITYSYLVVGINPERYAKTGYFENEYLDGKSPENFFKALVNQSDIIMQKDELAEMTTQSDYNITLYGEKYGVGIVSHDLTIVETYQYLPRYFLEEPDATEGRFRFTIVGSYSLVEEIAYSTTSISYEILIDIEEGYSISETAEDIEDLLKREVENVDEMNKWIGDSFHNRMLYGSLNTSVLFSMIIIVAVLALMVIIQLVENEKEIRMLKILGFSPKQFFSLFISESMLTVSFTIIFGLGIGSFAAMMLEDVLTIKTVIPESELVFPPLQILLIIFATVFTAIVTTTSTVGVLFRKEGKMKKKVSNTASNGGITKQ